MSSDQFLKGNFSEVLNVLKNSLENSATTESSFITNNNIAICTSLLNINNYENGDDNDEVLENLLGLYDNFRVLALHTGSTNKLHIQLIFLFNCEMYALYIWSKCPNKLFDWDGIISRVSNTFADVCQNHREGFVSLEDFLNSILESKKVMERSNLRHLGIFLEVICATILILLLTRHSSEDLESIYLFKQRVFSTTLETIALSKIECDLASEEEEVEIFKFSLNGDPEVYKNSSCEKALGTMAIIGSTLSLMINKSTSTKKFMLGKTYWSDLWFFIEALKKYRNEDFVGATGLLLHGKENVMSKRLSAQYCCLLGQSYSALRERHKALENYKKAISLDKNCSLVHYCIGIEYGKMGIHDSMIKSYQNLVLSTRKQKSSKCDGMVFETCIISLLKKTRSISRIASLYLLAISYGLNEMFEEAVDVFEKLLSPRNLDLLVNNLSNELITLPHFTTILHEAASTNLLIGNLDKAEDLCKQAMTFYPQHPKTIKPTDTHGTKDKQWIQDLINEDLNMDVEISETCLLYEDYLSFFEEDIIGLLLLADIQRIKDAETGRLTLNQALLLLSKHIAKLQKADTSPGSQEQVLLVKALTAKTCLHIAKHQATNRPFSDVDKMFKRALSCNNGDKDVLFHYATYLIDSNKLGEAQKLWATFFTKTSTVNCDDMQSLALKYLLRNQISQRQLVGLGLKVGCKT